jgi:rubrerythrin
MSNSIETVGKLFEYAIKLEEDSEYLYRQLGNMFSQYPDIALFWKRYADEEKGHAVYLERLRAGLDIDKLSRPADNSIFRKILQQFERSIRSKLEKVETLEDAFQLATELENSETNIIFEFMIVNFSTDELAKSHKFLRTQLSTHVARLEKDFPSPYKSRTARQNILVL